MDAAGSQWYSGCDVYHAYMHSMHIFVYTGKAYGFVHLSVVYHWHKNCQI